MKAYKVFNSDWKCRGFQYEVGRTYEMEESSVICNRGFHACEILADCFNYYRFDPNNKVAEVSILGEISKEDGDKVCTNKISIDREISWEEVLREVNTGKGNSGYRNSGNHNSGYRNSGDCNSGYHNSGNHNSGDCNSGDCNSGNHNSGNCNSGNHNSGNRNSGYFNTNEPFVRLFNKDTKLYRRDISFPHFFYFDTTQWVSHDTATEKEKEKYKVEIETSGGFLKTLDYKEAFKRAYANASKEDREKVKTLPNFDANIFFEISGIRIK